MNNFKTEITWSEDVRTSHIQRDQDTQEQSEMLEEFLSSQCDMFSSHDWYYYVEVTGKDLGYLKENATYGDPKGAIGTMLENAIIDNDYDLVEMFCL